MAGYSFAPDLALAVNSTPAYDLPRWDGLESDYYNTKLGLGPAIYIADGATFSDPRLVRWLAESGEARKSRTSSANPAAAGRTPAASTGAAPAYRAHPYPCRIDTVTRLPPSRRLEDWKNTLALLQAALNRLTPDLLAGARIRQPLLCL